MDAKTGKDERADRATYNTLLPSMDLPEALSVSRKNRRLWIHFLLWCRASGTTLFKVLRQWFHDRRRSREMEPGYPYRLSEVGQRLNPASARLYGWRRRAIQHYSLQKARRDLVAASGKYLRQPSQHVCGYNSANFSLESVIRI